MKPYLLFALLVLAGGAALVVGVSEVFGWGWAAMVGGALLMAAGLLVQPPAPERPR